MAVGGCFDDPGDAASDDEDGSSGSDDGSSGDDGNTDADDGTSGDDGSTGEDDGGTTESDDGGTTSDTGGGTSDSESTSTGDTTGDTTSQVDRWQYRRNITVESLGAQDMSKPHLVRLAPGPEGGSFEYGHANQDGSDIRFSTSTDQDAGFDLVYWIEEWNPAGVSLVWVLHPIPGQSSETVYMYYGNPVAATTTGEFEGAFPSRFVAAGGEEIAGMVNVDWFEIPGGATVSVEPQATVFVNSAAIRIAGTLDAYGAGELGGAASTEDQPGTPGQGTGFGGMGDYAGGGGGGFGGRGGKGGYDDNGDIPGEGGFQYGAPDSLSVELGSGGGGANALATGGPGGNGGGGITLQGTYDIEIPGTVSADGEDAFDMNGSGGGGGSGGHLVLLGTYINVTGMLSAQGGDGSTGVGASNDDGGGGGGGRIRIAWGEIGGGLCQTSTDVDGGLGGLYGTIPPEDGQDGTCNDGQISISVQVSIGPEIGI